MTKIYTKISDTEVEVTETISIDKINRLTVDCINQSIASLNQELSEFPARKTKLEARKAELEDELTTIEATLA